MDDAVGDGVGSEGAGCSRQRLVAGRRSESVSSNARLQGFLGSDTSTSERMMVRKSKERRRDSNEVE